MGPFLTIVTRCCHRPQMLRDNIASVGAQTYRSIQQLFIVDNDKQGTHAANRALTLVEPFVKGLYVYILDDDCWLTNQNFVDIADSITVGEPKIAMFKSLRPPGPPSRVRVFPTTTVWGDRTPRHGQTNCLCYLVRSELWKRNIEAFGAPAGGDWTFLKALMENEIKDGKTGMIWIDELVAESRQLGRGKLFEKTEDDWFKVVAKEHDLKHLAGRVWEGIHYQCLPHPALAEGNK